MVQIAEGTPNIPSNLEKSEDPSAICFLLDETLKTVEVEESKNEANY